jgi:hypothetical protein
MKRWLKCHRGKNIAWEEERRGKDGKYVTIGTSMYSNTPPQGLETGASAIMLEEIVARNTCQNKNCHRVQLSFSKDFILSYAIFAPKIVRAAS